MATDTLSVLLVYEDLSTGLGTWWAFEQTARQLEVEAGFDVDLWKFGRLRGAALP